MCMNNLSSLVVKRNEDSEEGGSGQGNVRESVRSVRSGHRFCAVTPARTVLCAWCVRECAVNVREHVQLCAVGA